VTRGIAAMMGKPDNLFFDAMVDDESMVKPAEEMAESYRQLAQTRKLHIPGT
jgi:hypothetical protein